MDIANSIKRAADASREILNLFFTASSIIANLHTFFLRDIDDALESGF